MATDVVKPRPAASLSCQLRLLRPVMSGHTTADRRPFNLSSCRTLQCCNSESPEVWSHCPESTVVLRPSPRSVPGLVIQLSCIRTRFTYGAPRVGYPGVDLCIIVVLLGHFSSLLTSVGPMFVAACAYGIRDLEGRQTDTQSVITEV